jgi:hypothetical protein
MRHTQLTFDGSRVYSTGGDPVQRGHRREPGWGVLGRAEASSFDAAKMRMRLLHSYIPSGSQTVGGECILHLALARMAGAWDPAWAQDKNPSIRCKIPSDQHLQNTHTHTHIIPPGGQRTAAARFRHPATQLYSLVRPRRCCPSCSANHLPRRPCFCILDAEKCVSFSSATANPSITLLAYSKSPPNYCSLVLQIYFFKKRKLADGRPPVQALATRP